MTDDPKNLIMPSKIPLSHFPRGTNGPAPPARIHKNSVLKQFHMNAHLSLVFSMPGNHLFEKHNAMLNMHFSLKCDLFSGWYLCSTFN